MQSFILNRQIVTNISFMSRPVSNKLTSYHIYTYIHILTYILDSQALRVSRICLSEKDFKAHICRMKEKPLINYREKMMNDHVDKVVFDENSPAKKSSKIGIPFVATYQPKVEDFGKLIKDLPTLI